MLPKSLNYILIHIPAILTPNFALRKPLANHANKNNNKSVRNKANNFMHKKITKRKKDFVFLYIIATFATHIARRGPVWDSGWDADIVEMRLLYALS